MPPVPPVVTDLREPLTAVHRRLIRRRTACMVVWIAGWVATGFVADTAWLALTILAVSGPGVWLGVWWWNRGPAGRRVDPQRAGAARQRITRGSSAALDVPNRASRARHSRG